MVHWIDCNMKIVKDGLAVDDRAADHLPSATTILIDRHEQLWFKNIYL